MKYNVKVKFHQDFVKVAGKEIIIGIKSKPEKGKANKEIITKLAKHFKVPISKVKIVSGLKSRNKVIEII